MANYNKELLQKIREEKDAGLTYMEIQKKHNLKSNNLIKIALNKITGNDLKYRGKYKTVRCDILKDLKETELRYNALYLIARKFFTYEELELLINNKLKKIMEGLKDVL